MVRDHRPGPLVVLGFLLLVSVACLQQAQASLGVLWRATVLSWDSPITQLQDEAAGQGAVHDDAARRARDATLAAGRDAQRLVLSSPPEALAPSALESPLTRAPPLR
jgi:hypothetical protein